MLKTVGQDQWTRFCGFELKWKNDTQLMIGQESYTKELLKRHQDVIPRSSPMPKVDIPEEIEDDATAQEVKAAQGLTGELLWLAIRSRPESFLCGVGYGKAIHQATETGCNVGKACVGFFGYYS